MTTEFDIQVHRMSDILYNVKHKMTDLEFYNLMETLTLIAKSRRVIYEPRIPIPDVASESSNETNESDHIPLSSSNGSCSSSDICY